MEEARQVCDGCRWRGDVYCWHPVFDDADDLVHNFNHMAKKFTAEELRNGSPVWCPGKQIKKELKVRT